MLGQAQHLLLGSPWPCLHWAGGPILASLLVTKGPHSTELPQTVLHTQVLPCRVPAVGTQKGTSFTSKPVTTPRHTSARQHCPTPERALLGTSSSPKLARRHGDLQTAEGRVSKPAGRDSREGTSHPGVFPGLRKSSSETPKEKLPDRQDPKGCGLQVPRIPTPSNVAPGSSLLHTGRVEVRILGPTK